MKKFIKKLFCKHEWVTNWAAYGYSGPEDVLIPESMFYIKVCKKCGCENI